jgi:hypothetical protein
VLRVFCLILLFALFAAPATAIQSPEEFLGSPVGADRHLFSWDEILSYLDYLDAQSDRLELVELGRSTEGRRFVLAVVADEEGIANQDRARADVRELYLVDETGEERAREIARDGRAILAFSMGIHSTEVGAPQASMEILHRMVTAEDPVTVEARERLMILMVPCMNPDGLSLVQEWYMQTVDTEAEGTRPLDLYHPYAGHDNNRDGFYNNLAETKMWSRVLYDDWLPQMVIDEHQMGSSGPRLFLPPFDDPVSPTVHPLVYSQLAAAGQQAVSDLTAQGWTGIATSTIFTAEWPGSVRSTGFWHNMLGVLSEVASARLATPLYFPEGSLHPRGRGMDTYERSANFLEPWPGGWWRLRDIVDMEIDLTWAFLRWASERREDLLLNFWRMNRDAVERGRSEAPYAFVIPFDQALEGHDVRLVEILQAGGVEVERSDTELLFDGRVVPEGGWVVRMAQPFRPFVEEMLGETEYPRIVQDGEPVRPYDVTAWRLSAMLGVEVHPVGDPDAVDAFDLREAERQVTGSRRWTPPGREGEVSPRIALYSPWGGSMDEGWTRLVLDRNGLDYQRIRPGEPEFDGASDGRRLRQRFDVILLPSIRTGELREGRMGNGRSRLGDAVWPEEFRRGIGPGAGDALRAFAEDGGRIVAISDATPWVIDAMGLPVSAEGGRSGDTYAPGTLLRVELNEQSRISRGMPSEVSAYYASGYRYTPSAWPEPTIVAARYSDRDLLVAGFLDGGGSLEGAPAVIQVPLGVGEVVLFGFHPQRRAQTDGTFPLLFNALWP